MMIFGKLCFFHACIMTDSAGSTGPISSGLSFPAVAYAVEVNRFGRVHFRLKWMKWQSFPF
jgi:hypothetical protein